MLGTHQREFAWRTLEVEHAAVRAVINALTDEQMTRPDTIQYGLYAGQALSFKDLLAHLICYEELSLAAYAEWRAGRKHPIIDGLRSGRDDMRVHFEGIAIRRPHSLAQVVEDWERFQAEIVEAVRSMSDADWHGAPPFACPYPLDLGGMFEIILCPPPRPPYRHLPVHIPDAGQFIKRLREGR